MIPPTIARLAVLAASLLLLALGASAQQTVRVSSNPAGATGSNASYGAQVSADGRYVAFTSDAFDLVAGDTNGAKDVFVRDLATGVTERVSVDSAGAQGTGTSSSPVISADGRFVAFWSTSADLVPGDTNATPDIFVHDRSTGATERVSVGPGGAQGDGGSTLASISADGSQVAFASFATNFDAADTNGVVDVFVRDRLAGTTERVSVDSNGLQANGESDWIAISADGLCVAFRSLASNLVAGDTNLMRDIFTRDRAAGTTQRVSVGAAGVEASGDSFFPALSADGRLVAYSSHGATLVPGDTNNAIDVFVHDRISGLTQCASVDPSGVPGGGNAPSISADGRFVAFNSAAMNFVPGDTNFRDDVFVRDLLLGTTERVSVGTSGAQANEPSLNPSISRGGRVVTFVSSATNLVTPDANGLSDVFARVRPSYHRFCFGDGLDASHTTSCPCANDGAPGRGCANSFDPNGALLTVSGTTSADDVTLFGSGMPPTSICIYMQGDALDDAPFGDGVRCVGGALVRLRIRGNVAGASSFPDPTDTVTLSQRGGVVPGSGVRRYYQTHYRNAAAAFCPPETFNVTNGVVVDW